jgi:hypothetical protein
MIDSTRASRFRSVGKNLTAGVANTIYTCPNNFTARVELLFVCNNTGGNKTIQIQWHDTSTGLSYVIVGGYVVSSHNFFKLDQAYIVLNAGDYLSVTPEAGSTMDATVSVEEYFDPATRV